MPLAALPASNTPRFFIGLVNAGQQHHMQVRAAPSITPEQAVIDLGFVATTLQPSIFNDYTFNELLFAEEGSDIRNPVPGWEPIDGTAVFAQNDQDQPLTLCARGRSTTGRKVRAFIYGADFVRTTDWILNPVAESGLDLFLGILVATPSYFLAIDGTKPVWKLDYTIGYNDHWVGVARP